MLCMVELGAPTAGCKLWDGTAPDFERSCKCNLKCDTELCVYTLLLTHTHSQEMY